MSYLATSKFRTSLHIGFGSWWLVTGVYFFKCRTEFDKKLKENKELGEIMNLIIKYRGTELEGQFQEKYHEKLMEMDKKAKYV